VSDDEQLLGLTIPVQVDLTNLGRESSSRLAMLWHVAQENPAPHGDPEAGEIVAKITFEIVRRWLAAAQPELHHHQPRDHYWQALVKFARWDGQQWVAREDPKEATS
jgi:hypothetical protein